MGNAISVPPEPEVIVPPPPPPPPPAPKYDLSLKEAQVYLQNRVPVTSFIGGLTGTAAGYYIGDMMGLYGYSGAFGAGLASTAFYGTNYLLRCARQQDDVYNYAASGCINGFWIAAGLSRSSKKGAVGAACGILFGVGYKVGGDWLYDMSRSAWLNYRTHQVAFGRPRLLEPRRPMFDPKDVEGMDRARVSGSIIPKRGDRPLTPPIQSTAAVDKDASSKKGGWLW